MEKSRLHVLRQKISKFTIVNDDECWIWTGTKSHHGHGVARYKYKRLGAHRASWEVFMGPIPLGGFVCHKCDVPACVNPDHLYIGDAKTNNKDMWERALMPIGERNKNSKLKEWQIPLIRNDCRKHRDIAKDYGVTHRIIGLIKRGEAWKHVNS